MKGHVMEIAGVIVGVPVLIVLGVVDMIATLIRRSPIA